MADILARGMAATAQETANTATSAIEALPKGLVYKGAVNTYADLPANADTGDTYTVKADEFEYAWGNYEGVNQWIKLGADYSAEIAALQSGKQNVISDLSTIRSGAALGATAIQSHQSLAAYRTSADQDIIDAGKQDTLTAGANITIQNNVISATGGGSTYTAGANISIDNNVISATDTTYSAGSGISISNNVISATGGVSSFNGKTGNVILHGSQDMDVMEDDQGQLYPQTVYGGGVSYGEEEEVDDYTGGASFDSEHQVMFYTKTYEDGDFAQGDFYMVEITLSNGSETREIQGANSCFIENGKYQLVWLNQDGWGMSYDPNSHRVEIWTEASSFGPFTTLSELVINKQEVEYFPILSRYMPIDNNTIGRDDYGNLAVANPLPVCPNNNDGTFVLKCVVSQGNRNYQWVSEGPGPEPSGDVYNLTGVQDAQNYTVTFSGSDWDAEALASVSSSPDNSLAFKYKDSNGDVIDQQGAGYGNFNNNVLTVTGGGPLQNWNFTVTLSGSNIVAHSLDENWWNMSLSNAVALELDVTIANGGEN